MTSSKKIILSGILVAGGTSGLMYLAYSLGQKEGIRKGIRCGTTIAAIYNDLKTQFEKNNETTVKSGEKTDE